jgi:hypothetical protein
MLEFIQNAVTIIVAIPLFIAAAFLILVICCFYLVCLYLVLYWIPVSMYRGFRDAWREQQEQRKRICEENAVIPSQTNREIP